MMGVAVWAICQDQCEYHTIQKAEIPVWDILPWSMQVKVETSDWDKRRVTGATDGAPNSMVASTDGAPTDGARVGSQQPSVNGTPVVARMTSAK